MGRYSIIKLDQYFGGQPVFRIVDTKERGVDMYRIKINFKSRKEANDYIKKKLK